MVNGGVGECPNAKSPSSRDASLLTGSSAQDRHTKPADIAEPPDASDLPRRGQLLSLLLSILYCVYPDRTHSRHIQLRLTVTFSSLPPNTMHQCRSQLGKSFVGEMSSTQLAVSVRHLTLLPRKFFHLSSHFSSSAHSFSPLSIPLQEVFVV